MKKRLIALLLAFILIFSVPCACFADTENSNEKSITVTLRVEGYKETLYNKTVDVKYLTDSVSLQNALSLIDEQEADIEFTGTGTGFVTAINGETSGTFGGNDGWGFAVNNSVYSSSIGDVMLHDGDSIVFFYADEGAQYTLVDSSEAKDGIIRFYSRESQPDGTYSEKPIFDATVIFDETEYKTDAGGKINTGKTLGNGEYTLSFSKVRSTDSGNLPVAVRLTDYKLVISDKIEPANLVAYIIVTAVVLILIAAGAFFLLMNKKRKKTSK